MSLRIRPTASRTATVPPAERYPDERYPTDRPPRLATAVSPPPVADPLPGGQPAPPAAGCGTEQVEGASPRADRQESGVDVGLPAGTRSELRAARRLRRRLMVACAMVIAVCVVLTVLIVGVARDRRPVSAARSGLPAGRTPTAPTLAPSALTLSSRPPIPSAPAP